MPSRPIGIIALGQPFERSVPLPPLVTLSSFFPSYVWLRDLFPVFFTSFPHGVSVFEFCRSPRLSPSPFDLADYYIGPCLFAPHLFASLLCLGFFRPAFFFSFLDLFYWVGGVASVCCGFGCPFSLLKFSISRADWHGCGVWPFFVPDSTLCLLA